MARNRGPSKPSRTSTSVTRLGGDRPPPPPGRRQIKILRNLEKRLGWKRKWVDTRSDATGRIRKARRELIKRESRAERERHPDQWSLPAAETQKYQLRRAGIDFPEDLTRRQAHELLIAPDSAEPGPPSDAVWRPDPA